MDTKQYHLDAKITLNPIWHSEPPEVLVSFNNDVMYAGHLYTPLTFQIDKNLKAGQYQLMVEFVNKKNTDTVNGLDKAINIEKIAFNNIESPQFAWQGIYYPTYPEPWASQQTDLKTELTQHTYLGWNGKWLLTFDIPIFTWIHRVENLGWIYD